MTKTDIIQDFETEVMKIKEECFKNLKSGTVIEVFDKFQKEVADSFSEKVHFSIINNVSDRENLLKELTDIFLKYAADLKSKVQ